MAANQGVLELGRRELGSCHGTQGYLQLPCPQDTKSEVEMITSGEEVRRGRDPGAGECQNQKISCNWGSRETRPLLLWEGSKSFPSPLDGWCIVIHKPLHVEKRQGVSHLLTTL